MKRLATSELDNLQPQYDFAALTRSPPVQTAPNGQVRHNDAIVSSTREDGSMLYVPGGHGTHSVPGFTLQIRKTNEFYIS